MDGRHKGGHDGLVDVNFLYAFSLSSIAIWLS
jgi:hypothetical protein